jgi:hypothetical protein
MWAPLPHLGRALYVSEQECDGTCWRAGHYYLDVLLASLKRTL